jgi:hypothetical protein
VVNAHPVTALCLTRQLRSIPQSFPGSGICVPGRFFSGTETLDWTGALFWETVFTCFQNEFLKGARLYSLLKNALF